VLRESQTQNDYSNLYCKMIVLRLRLTCVRSDLRVLQNYFGVDRLFYESHGKKNFRFISYRMIELRVPLIKFIQAKLSLH